MIAIRELRSDFGLSKRETQSIEEAMNRELQAGGGKWFKEINNRLQRVITQLWVERKQREVADGFNRKKLIAAASTMLKTLLKGDDDRQ